MVVNCPFNRCRCVDPYWRKFYTHLVAHFLKMTSILPCFATLMAITLAVTRCFFVKNRRSCGKSKYTRGRDGLMGGGKDDVMLWWLEPGENKNICKTNNGFPHPKKISCALYLKCDLKTNNTQTHNPNAPCTTYLPTLTIFFSVHVGKIFHASGASWATFMTLSSPTFLQMSSHQRGGIFGRCKIPNLRGKAPTVWEAKKVKFCQIWE